MQFRVEDKEGEKHLAARLTEDNTSFFEHPRPFTNSVGFQFAYTYLCALDGGILLRVAQDVETSSSIIKTRHGLDIFLNTMDVKALQSGKKCEFSSSGYTVRIEHEKYLSQTSEWPVSKAA